MIKTVLFDYGGVLSEGGKRGAIAQAIAKTYGVDVAAVRALHLGPLISKMLRGAIDSQTYFAKLDKQLHKAPSDWKERQAQYIASASVLSRCEPVYDLAERLRRHGVKTGIFSNISDFLANELERRGCYDHFQPLLLSCREHMEKAEDGLYQLAVQRTGVTAGEILVIDDQDRWRAPTERAGMRFLHAASPTQIVHDTETLMLKENGLKL